MMFDVYGTLFISGSGDIGIAKKKSPEAYEQAYEETYELEQLLIEFKIRKTPKAVLNDFFAGIEKKHDKLRKQGIDFPEVEIDRIWMSILKNNDLVTVRKFAVRFEMIVNPVYPMPNLEEMLSACKKSKILLGIISNAQFYTSCLFEWLLDSNLEKLGFHPDLILFSYKSGHAKPSPFMFQSALERLKRLNVPANSALYIGNDMLNDIYPAKKTGFNTALFAGDTRSLRLRKDVTECKTLSPDLVITDLIQLLDYI
ncbi:MAG: HAD hydrolase-like protein [Desulfobacterales bacterium]|uniref:HAD hydrolase-like protein n=1 Tax=Candidatus Desulfaltia bathyphila TaxID=2841697 RepID=A0A8J6N5Z0_9BACT|nr:HAD hydrolase-like protein [Candidatus Desulfaltia bathyphila]MBL7195305.1 HAD hydrolase-like protein [Desulfobacterales bacterium]MBL7207227.1 HAD hydrolase-like protein [Desulfobacterales bacterium]